MPAKNTIKTQVPDGYYHTYLRGNNKQAIFQDRSDYDYYMHLINRYISKKEQVNDCGRVFPNYYGKVEILAYCLMPNHFHMLIYQIETPYLEKFMRSMMTSYSRYYNLKYNKTGPLFESRYKGILIDNESYLLHISRYIHLNNSEWRTYNHSSFKYYLLDESPEWINTLRILEMFDSKKAYVNFTSDYEEMRNSIKIIKHLLADK